MFNLLGCPTKETVYKDGHFKYIMRVLGIPNNSYTSAKNTMNDILECCEMDTDYEPVLKDRLGPTHLIVHGAADAEVVYTSCERGLSHAMITVLVNTSRLNHQLPRISRSTISRFIKSSPHIKVNIRPSRVSICNTHKHMYSIRICMVYAYV